MEIREIQSKGEWEGFLAGCKDKTFLQSWAWGEFQQRMGNAIWRLGVFNGKEVAGAALVVRVRAKRGTFLMVQHLVLLGKEVFAALLEEIKRIGSEEGAGFIRIAPLWANNRENEAFFKE